ncbi:MAG: TetR family transcriptional regulator [Bacteriovoracaceae bacterium]
MNRESDQGTKEKILDVSCKLFSQKGFNGTSIRDIATAADVNVASINYHFKNKQNLLIEVMRSGYHHFSESVSRIEGIEKMSFVEASTRIAILMTEMESIVLNQMKIMLSSEIEGMFEYNHGDEMIGPPGGQILFTILKQELKAEEISEESLNWGVRMVIGAAFHLTAILNSPCATSTKNKEFLNRDWVIESITKLSKSISHSIKHNII